MQGRPSLTCRISASRLFWRKIVVFFCQPSHRSPQKSFFGLFRLGLIIIK
jgi:hypothetical protein